MKPQSVAQKFAAFAKQGWTVASKELDKKKKPQPVPGSGGVIWTDNPYNTRHSPLNNSVWSTNFKVDGEKSGSIPGVNVVQRDQSGAVNIRGAKGTSAKAKGGGFNVPGPKGTGLSVNPPKNGTAGVNLNAGKVGSASLSAHNGASRPGGTVNVMGPDGKVHTVSRDFGEGPGKFLGPVLGK
jgi:hypothetical protein